MYNLALSNFTGEGIIRSDQENSMTASLVKARNAGTEQKIRVQNIVDFLSGFDRVNALKMDIEGGEFDCINELSRYPEVYKKIDYMIIECHHNLDGYKFDLSDLLPKLKEMSFKTVLESSFNGYNKTQDILCYCSK